MNTDITVMISTKFGMQDVVVYGAHRVGKKRPNISGAIVCTLLDAYKRAIVLEKTHIYFKRIAHYTLVKTEHRASKKQGGKHMKPALIRRYHPWTLKNPKNEETRPMGHTSL